MDFKKCCCTLFWGGIIVLLHLKMNGNFIDTTISKIKPKVDDALENLKK